METSDKKRNEGEYGIQSPIHGKHIKPDIPMFVNDLAHRGLISVSVGGGTAELCEMPEGIEGLENPVYFFNRIKVRPHLEGTGLGKALMIEICKLADKHGITIFNGLNPYGKRGLQELISFFKGSGFEMHSDDGYGGVSMIRKPNTE